MKKNISNANIKMQTVPKKIFMDKSIIGSSENLLM